MSEILLECKDLCKSFNYKRSKLLAVDNVSFALHAGETLGLVGESGSGKSTIARLILRLLNPDSGEITYQSKLITKLSPSRLKEFRKHSQIVFQDTHSSLDPHWKVGASICEPLAIYGFSRAHQQKRLTELLNLVELPADSANRYPHEFSGGQKQRIGIARALALEPSLIVLDEPVSALDISIQAQIINLLERLKRELKLTYLLIAHDLAVVRHLSDHVAVLYLGEIVEYGSAVQIFEAPQHPYTKSLLAAIPKSLIHSEIQLLAGEIPSPINRPPGCVFHPRCPSVMDICNQKIPLKTEITPSNYVCCHLYK